MEPRLKSSKKWTSFPKEYLAQIETVFNENFSQFLGDAELIIDGRIYPQEILFRVGYLEKGRLQQANFEFSVIYNQEDVNALEQIHLCVDAAGTFLMDYLDNQETEEYPLLWKELHFDNKNLFFKFSTENSRLEEEANRLLGEDSSLLVQEDESSEDALAYAEIDPEISPDPDDEDWEAEEDTDSTDEGSESDEQQIPPKSKRQLH
ncbi:MAG: hypothetical protein ACLGGX_07035 [Bdellovibrionia bacterium]